MSQKETARGYDIDIRTANIIIKLKIKSDYSADSTNKSDNYETIFPGTAAANLREYLFIGKLSVLTMEREGAPR